MHKQAHGSGSAQRRQRRHMQERGWSSITTYITKEHKRRLDLIKEAHGLTSLHEALHLALSQKDFDQGSPDGKRSEAARPQDLPACRASDAHPTPSREESAP